MEEDEFRDLIGVTKHRAYLNFHYGVVLEEALQLAAEEEARKRHMARCFADTEDLVEEAFRQLYQKSRSELLEQFRYRGPHGPPPGHEPDRPQRVHLLAPQAPH